MKSFNWKKSFDIPRSSGQVVMGAVALHAINLVVENDRVDGKEVFSVGQRSNDASKHLIVLVNGTTKIDPKAHYKNFTVMHHHWGGKIDVDFDENSARGLIDGFAAVLNLELSCTKRSIKPVYKWIPVEKILRDLLTRDPDAHLETVVQIYAGMGRIFPKDARSMIKAIKKAEKKTKGRGLVEFLDLVTDNAIDNLNAQAAI
jgi:hypothetical protein